jgi:pyruvate-ferredoxin/flavodoxin oxidoreductase
VWDHLPREVQEQIIDKKLEFYVIDADAVAREAGMGNRINTVMQPCFFAALRVLPRERGHRGDQARSSRRPTASGAAVVERNFAASTALGHLREVPVPRRATATSTAPPHRCPTTRPTSSKRSPACCSPARATCCR